MQQIWPDKQELSLIEAYQVDGMVESGFLRLNMVESLDGSISFDGRARELSSEIDQKCFKTMRTLADAILVGSSTARIENYKPIAFNNQIQQERIAMGQSKELPIVVVTESFNFDLSQELFSNPLSAPIIACSEISANKAGSEFKNFEILTCGENEIDFALLKDTLVKLGYNHILCEGGPILNSHLLDAGVIDELCLTITPKVVRGSGPRLFDGELLSTPKNFSIDKIYFEEDQLFLRCTRVNS